MCPEHSGRGWEEASSVAFSSADTRSERLVVASIGRVVVVGRAGGVDWPLRPAISRRGK